MRAEPSDSMAARRWRRTVLRLVAPFCLPLCAAAAGVAHTKGQEAPRTTPPAPLRAVPRPGYLGLSMRDMDAGEVMRLHQRGAMIVTVDRDAPAWTAGLRPHDVIVAINGQPVDDVEALRRHLRDSTAGETVTLRVWRGESSSTVTVTLGDENAIATNAMSRHLRAFSGGPPASVLSSHFSDSGAPDPPDETNDHQSRASAMFEAITPGPYSGLTLAPVTPQFAAFLGAHTSAGLLVMEVAEHSPAAEAGLLAGDLLLRADGHVLRGRNDLEHALRTGKGGPVELAVLRQKRVVVVELTAGKRRKL